MRQTLKTIFSAALLLAVHSLFANPTLALEDLLDKNGRIHNPLHLSGTVDFSGFYPVLDDREGLRFLPAPPPVPGWNALGAGQNNQVLAIAISGSDVYAGMGSTGGANNFISRWDGSMWNPLGTGLSNNVLTVAVSGSDVYAGGEFTDAGGLANADYIARWDGSAWNALGPGVNSIVFAIAVAGSNVYAGGWFTDAGGLASADRIARWDGSAWNALGAGLNSDVFAIAVAGSDVYAGGWFTNAGGFASADHIARWNGSAWNALGTGLNSAVTAIAIAGSDVYVGGPFTNAGGNASADGITRWDGSTWNALGAGLNSEVNAIAISGSDVYVGGPFTNAGGNASADYIAHWDGSAWAPFFGAGLNSNVRAIAVSGSDVYAGGPFTDAGGIANADRIARWEAAPLPVALLDFQARAGTQDSVLLSWRTASERLNRGFGIERSINGLTWETLDFVPGHGTTSAPQAYTYTDQRPRPGANYYRLRQTDFDGRWEYSNVIRVEVEQAGGGIRFVPQPASGSVTLELPADYSGEANFLLYDLTGRLVQQQSLVLEGDASRAQVTLAGLPAGIYLARVQTGTEQWVQRLLVE